MISRTNNGPRLCDLPGCPVCDPRPDPARREELRLADDITAELNGWRRAHHLYRKDKYDDGNP